MSVASPLVLHLCTELSVGGAENHLVMLLHGLQEGGRYRPHIAAFRDAHGAMRSLRSDFERLGIPVHVLVQDRAYDVRGAGKLAALLKRLRPAILHTHLFRGDLYGPPIGALMGVPVRVSTVHNVEARFRHPVFRPLFQMTYRFDHGVVAISDAAAAELQRSLHLPRSKVRRIYYGFDPQVRWRSDAPQDLRAELGLASTDFVIGTIGRICEQKGQVYLIEAVDRLRQELPQLRLFIVGTPEPDGTYEMLRDLVARRDLERRVIFAGYRDSVRSVLAAMNVFVLPSLWEGFGLVLLEAMSVGKPIIASSVASIPEIVEDGVQGVLVPPRDPAALAEAIARLARSPEMLARMAAAGPARVRQFSVERMVDETIGLYDSLLVGRDLSRATARA